VSYHSLTELGGGRIRQGQILTQDTAGKVAQISTSIKLPDYEKDVITCYRGVEYELFDPIELTTFLSGYHVIHANSNRMGIITETENPLNHSHSILSSPVLPGTIQLPPSGKAIILGQDGQSIGGYPRVGKIVEEDYAILVQKRPGEKLRFEILPDLLP
jgi:allophanate hydrolase subunit 2